MDKKLEVGLDWVRNGATRKGYLYKQGGSRKGWKKRWFCVKNNELFYFENSDESKLKGKIVLDDEQTLTEINDPKLKQSFVFKLDGKSLKKPRILAGETDKLRKEWMSAIESIMNQKNLKCEGILYKQGPKRQAWKKRFCTIKGGELLYYRQQKDLVPVGIVCLDECKSLEACGPDVGKPFSFVLEHKFRKYYFYVDSLAEMEQWTASLRSLMGLKHMSASSGWQVQREVFLSKPLKEGILNKQKKRDQLKKTKPVRLVLTNNFVYYFPNASSNSKFHSMHLSDCIIETIPSSIERIPNSFRLVNFAHPLYLGADDEKEFNLWVSIIENTQAQLSFQTESKTDSGIKTETNVDYTVEVLEEKVDKTAMDLGLYKSYVIQVRAFWTTWAVTKTYAEIYDLYEKVLQRFPNHIFPEASKYPLYIDQLQSPQTPRSLGRRNSLLSKLAVLPTKTTKPGDDQYDYKFICCLFREILRNRAVSQCDLILTFFELDSIFLAISRGEIAFVRYFLDKAGINLKELNKTGHTPLHYAAERKSKTIVEAIVTSGGDPSFPNRKGQPCLHFALEIGASSEIVQYLVSSGASLSEKDEGGATPLHYAVRNPEFVQLLIDNGASLNAQDKECRTPLHSAIIQEQVESLKVLIQAGANLEIPDDEGFTPLLMSCWMKREEMVKVLLNSGANPDAVDKNKRSAIHLSVLRKDDICVGLLIDAKANLEQTNGSGLPPLHVATSKGNESIVELMISKRVDLTVREDNLKQTALHIAASANKLKIAEMLTKAKPTMIDTPDNDGKTPLHIAAENDNVGIVKYLISCGAAIGATDKNQETPLHCAAVKASAETIQALLLARANTAARNREGWLPLHVAAFNGNEVGLPLLMETRSDLNAKNDIGNTPLHLALIQKHYKIAIILGEHGANPSLVNMEGKDSFALAPKNVQQSLQESSKAGPWNFVP